MASIYSISGLIRSTGSEGINFGGSFLFHNEGLTSEIPQENVAGEIINHQSGPLKIHGFFIPMEYFRFEEVDNSGNRANAEFSYVQGNEWRGKYDSTGLGIRPAVCWISEGVLVRMDKQGHIIFPEPARDVMAVTAHSVWGLD